MKLRNIPFSPPDMSEAEAKLASEAITEHTKVICPVGLGGIVCDVNMGFGIMSVS